MKKITMLIVFILVTMSGHLAAQSVTGIWKTIDDETGKAKSHIKIYKQDGKLRGKIVKVLDNEPDAPCDECPEEGKFKSRGDPMKGLHIIKGLEKDDGEWEADNGIMDPENGKVYDCKVWLDEENQDQLNVRGYIGFFYRTQNWQRVR